MQSITICLILLVSLQANASFLGNEGVQALSPFQLYQGFVMGFYEEGGLKIETIQACMTDAKGAATDFSEAVEQFIKTKNFEEGKKILIMGLDLLKYAVKDCQESSDEMTTIMDNLQNAIDLLQNNPTQFAVHVVKDIYENSDDLRNEVNEIKKHYELGNSNQLGYNLGRAFYQIVIGIKA